MKIAQVQFAPWENTTPCQVNDFEVSDGDLVVAKTEFGEDLGRVLSISDSDTQTEAEILRPANNRDLDEIKAVNADKKKSLSYCRRIIEKHDLDMKLVECRGSLDDKKITFAFIAEGRVDFRDLVKDLTKHFQKSIRLHQLGVRDEAKLTGDIGHCGRNLCCRGFLDELTSVTSDYADDQQIAHRGSDRLSGICGRLKCCLAYEEKTYKDIIKKLPPIGTRVDTKRGKGIVVGWHVLKKSVEVKLDTKDDEQSVVEIKIND